MEQLPNHAASGAFVGLFSALGREFFYQKFGFVVRPTETLGPGKILSWKNYENTVGCAPRKPPSV